MLKIKMKSAAWAACALLALNACRSEEPAVVTSTERPTVTRVTALSKSKVVLEGSGLSQVSRAGIVDNTTGFTISDRTSNSVTLTPNSPVTLVAGTVYRFFVQDALGQTSTAEITLTVDASQVTGILPIAKGGTGSNTAAGARATLGMGTLATGNFTGSASQVLRGDGTWGSLPSSGITACDSGMTLIPGSTTSAPFCINTDAAASVTVPYATAVIICASSGKHLCGREELKKACDSGLLTATPLTSNVHWAAETYTIVTSTPTAAGQVATSYGMKTINGGCGGTDQDSLLKVLDGSGRVTSEATHYFRCCAR
ncbi:MAG: hypothetical protein JNL01_12800 [Bdellovibrionales bacterium]|nr:hypothetical protein [Bdellovibrionales bacterium]